MTTANDNRPRPPGLLERLGLAPRRDLVEALNTLQVFVVQETNAARMSYGVANPCTDEDWYSADPDGYELVRRAEALIARVAP